MENIKTKRIGKKCPGCGNSEYKKIISAKDSSFYSDEIWTYVKCKKCKLVYLNPQPSIEELTNHYESISNKIKVSKGVKLVMFLKNLQVRFTKIIPINKTGNLLDIGCGKDPFLEIQKKGVSMFSELT